MSHIQKELADIIRQVTPTVTLKEERDFDRPFKDIGIDSLDTMSIFLGVQEKFGIGDIPDAEIDQLKTVNQIAAYVRDRLSDKGPAKES